MAGRGCLLIFGWMLLTAISSCVTGEDFPVMVSHGLGDRISEDQKKYTPENPFTASQVSINRGRKVFHAHCQRCHGRDGHGMGPDAADLPVKPANLSNLASQYPDYYFYRQIAYGQEDMPSWRESLSDTQIWDVVNYIKTMH